MKKKYFRYFFTFAFLLAFVSFANAQCNINSFTLTAVNGTCAQDTKVNVAIAGGVTCDNATATIRLQGTTTDLDFKTLTASGNATFDNLKPGTYQVRVQQGATTTAYKNVTTTSTYVPLNVTVTSQNTSCGAQDDYYTANGSVKVVFSGGNGPYKITLAGPGGPYVMNTPTSGTFTFPNLGTGTYNATVEDLSASCYSAEVRTASVADTQRPRLSIYQVRRMVGNSCGLFFQIEVRDGNRPGMQLAGNATYTIAGDPTVYPLNYYSTTSTSLNFRTLDNLPINTDVTFSITDGCNKEVFTRNTRTIKQNFYTTHNVSIGANCQMVYTSTIRTYDIGASAENNTAWWNFSDNSQLKIYKEVPADSNNWVQVQAGSGTTFGANSTLWVTRQVYVFTTDDYSTRYKYSFDDANDCNDYEKIIDARTAPVDNPLQASFLQEVPSVLGGTSAFTIYKTNNGGRWGIQDQLNFPITIKISRADGQTSMPVNAPNPYSISGAYNITFPYSVVSNAPDWTYNQPLFSDLPLGDYVITLTDKCGQVVTKTISLTKPTTYNPSVQSVIGCAASDIIYNIQGTNLLNESKVRLRANSNGALGTIVRNFNENPSNTLQGQFSTVPPGDYFVEFTTINNLPTLTTALIPNSAISTWSVARNLNQKDFSYYAPIKVLPYKVVEFSTVSIFCNPSNPTSGILAVSITNGTPVGSITYSIWNAISNPDTTTPLQTYTTNVLTETSHVFTGLTASDYIVRVIQACGSSQQTVTLSPGPATFPDPVGVPDKICNVGDSTVLAMPLPTSLFDITWKDNVTGTVVGTGSSITVTPLVTTTYKVEYVLKSSFGCSQPYSGSGTVTVEVGNCFCYKPATTTGTTLDTKHGITALGRAGAQTDNWPMLRKGAWTALEAKTKGFVPNRIATTALVQAIPNPVEGMMVYDEQAACLKIYTSTDNGTTFSWKCFTNQTCPDY